MLPATTILRHSDNASKTGAPSHGTVVLKHDDRHLRLKTLTLTEGAEVFVDLTEPAVLNNGDRLLLEDGSTVEIVAVIEELYVVTARDTLQLIELAWHIGNRHLPAAIFFDRILILRNHVICSMLKGLGATVQEITAPFNPVRGAYGSHDGQDSHAHGDPQSDHHHHHP